MQLVLSSTVLNNAVEDFYPWTWGSHGLEGFEDHAQTWQLGPVRLQQVCCFQRAL